MRFWMLLAGFLVLSCGSPSKEDPRDIFGDTGNNNNNETPPTYREYLFLPNQGVHTLSTYTINKDTGNLTFQSEVQTAQTPRSVVVLEAANLLFLSHTKNPLIYTYRIDPQTGSLSLINQYLELPPNDNEEVKPMYLVLHPNGKFLYASMLRRREEADGSLTLLNGRISAYAIDVETGALNRITRLATQIEPYKLSISPSGMFIYVANLGTSTTGNSISHYSIIEETGSIELVSHIGTGTRRPICINFHPITNLAYACDYTESTVSTFSQNMVTGALSHLGTTSTYARPWYIEADSEGKYLYVAARTTSGAPNARMMVFEIDGNALTEIQDLSMAGLGPLSFAFSSSGKFLYTSNYDAGSISVMSVQPNGLLTVERQVGLVTEANPRALTTARLVQP